MKVLNKIMGLMAAVCFAGRRMPKRQAGIYEDTI